MGKIVMPKNSALLNEIEAVLEIYYNHDGWLDNEKYKQELMEKIGDDQYSSSYTKKAQITSYFGFTVWQDINNPQSMRRITDSGKRMYRAIMANDVSEIQDTLMNSLETTKFGRNNFGCPSSDSDIEPPSLFIRACLDLEYLTYQEFAYLLWKLEDVGGNYTDALADIRQSRITGNLPLGEEAQKYTDCKPIMILVRWGFLSSDTTEFQDAPGGQKITINPEVKSRYLLRLKNLKIYNIDMDTAKPHIDKDRELSSSSEFKGAGENVLFYGVPGSGKSWTIKHEYCDDEDRITRVVFHPDYTHSDFIGQILPTVKDGIISYSFIPGPFTEIIKKANDNHNINYFLIIEEINRGNAPAIFGEVFQLLDRTQTGESEYGITNSEMANSIFGDPTKKITIPSNLSILATMNTSDQNVFTLDTAFQRRWKMRLVENSFEGHSYAEKTILDTSVTWKHFCEVINTAIVEKNFGMSSSEDKRLGAYFVSSEYLDYIPETGTTDEKIAAKNHNSLFSEKVIKYLWDDAFKFSREDIFRSTIYKTLDEALAHFNGKYDDNISGNERLGIFRQEIVDALISINESVNQDTNNHEVIEENH